jgi:hypothetical protein
MMPSWSGHMHQYVEIKKLISSMLGTKLNTHQDTFDFIHFRAVAQGISREFRVLAPRFLSRSL